MNDRVHYNRVTPHAHLLLHSCYTVINDPGVEEERCTDQALIPVPHSSAPGLVDGQPAGEQLQQHDAEGVDVAAGGQVARHDVLRSSVPHRPHDLRGGRGGVGRGGTTNEAFG